MGYYKGIVTRVHVGDPQPPKQEGWSESAKFGVQIDGKWHNGFVNKDKHTGAFTIKDKNFNEVKEGCEIEFMTTEKNGFENIDKKTMAILSSGSAAQTPQQPQQQPVAQQPAQQEKVAQNASGELTKEELILMKHYGRAAEDKAEESGMTDDLKLIIADGQAASNALSKGKLPTGDMLNRVSGYYFKVL
jgi:glucan-binding YG repeat protein